MMVLKICTGAYFMKTGILTVKQLQRTEITYVPVINY